MLISTIRFLFNLIYIRHISLGIDVYVNMSTGNLQTWQFVSVQVSRAACQLFGDNEFIISVIGEIMLLADVLKNQLASQLSLLKLSSKMLYCKQSYQSLCCTCTLY